MHAETRKYNAALAPDDRKLCDLFAKEIDRALPDAENEVWHAHPVWSSGGMICTGETYRSALKLTFPKGASLPDPKGLFNAGLEGRARRAIDLREGDVLDARASKALIRAAAARNGAAARR